MPALENDGQHVISWWIWGPGAVKKLADLCMGAVDGYSDRPTGSKASMRVDIVQFAAYQFTACPTYH